MYRLKSKKTSIVSYFITLLLFFSAELKADRDEVAQIKNTNISFLLAAGDVEVNIRKQKFNKIELEILFNHLKNKRVKIPKEDSNILTNFKYDRINLFRSDKHYHLSFHARSEKIHSQFIEYYFDLEGNYIKRVVTVYETKGKKPKYTTKYNKSKGNQPSLRNE